jgi:hypothetical protein
MITSEQIKQLTPEQIKLFTQEQINSVEANPTWDKEYIQPILQENERLRGSKEVLPSIIIEFYIHCTELSLLKLELYPYPWDFDPLRFYMSELITYKLPYSNIDYFAAELYDIKWTQEFNQDLLSSILERFMLLIENRGLEYNDIEKARIKKMFKQYSKDFMFR